MIRGAAGAAAKAAGRRPARRRPGERRPGERRRPDDHRPVAARVVPVAHAAVELVKLSVNHWRNCYKNVETSFVSRSTKPTKPGKRALMAEAA